MYHLYQIIDLPLYKEYHPEALRLNRIESNLNVAIYHLHQVIDHPLLEEYHLEIQLTGSRTINSIAQWETGHNSLFTKRGIDSNLRITRCVLSGAF